MSGTVLDLEGNLRELGDAANIPSEDELSRIPTAEISAALEAADDPDGANPFITQTTLVSSVQGIIAAAPGALDTLDELAAALGDDANFATSVTNALAGKQASNAALTAIAGLSPSNDDVLQRKSGAWANRTMAQLIADLAALGTTFQPLDSDLTAIAALTTTAFGRSLLAAADAAALQTLAGTVIGTNVQAYDSDLAAIAALSTTSFGRSLLEAANAAALQTLGGLVIGTNVQAYDADLAAVAALTTTSFGRSLLEAANAAALRTLAATVIGTDVQAYDADLASIAALTTTSFGRGLLELADAAAARAALEGAWTSWTPAWASSGTPPALSNGTLVGGYKMIGAKTAIVRIRFVRGSSSTNGTGQYSFTGLPFTTAAADQMLNGGLLDSGTRWYVASGYVSASSTGILSCPLADAGGDATWAATSPMTFATNDMLILQGIIETA